MLTKHDLSFMANAGAPLPATPQEPTQAEALALLFEVARAPQARLVRGAASVMRQLAAHNGQLTHIVFEDAPDDVKRVLGYMAERLASQCDSDVEVQVLRRFAQHLYHTRMSEAPTKLLTGVSTPSRCARLVAAGDRTSERWQVYGDILPYNI